MFFLACRTLPKIEEKNFNDTFKALDDSGDLKVSYAFFPLSLLSCVMFCGHACMQQHKMFLYVIAYV